MRSDRRGLGWFAAAALIGVTVVAAAFWGKSRAPAEEPRLQAVGPRLISNQTDYQLMIYGEGLREGMRLRLEWAKVEEGGGGVIAARAEQGRGARSEGAADERSEQGRDPKGIDQREGLVLETRFIDSRRLSALLPGGWAIPPAEAIAALDATLEGAAGSAPLTIVNDAAFAVPLALEVIGEKIFVVSRTTDELYEIDGDGGIRRHSICDGPRAIASYTDSKEESWLVIACEFDGSLELVRAHSPGAGGRSIPLTRGLQGLLVSEGIAWVTEHRGGSVLAVDLEKGAIVRRLRSPVDPRPMALLGERLLVGNLSTEDLSLLRLDAPPARVGGAEAIEARAEKKIDTAPIRRVASTKDTAPIDGAASTEGTSLIQRVAPTKETAIVGGHTEPFAPYVMGGKRPNAIAASERLGVFFVSSLGPNIGPNSERMEVTMNGGVGVVDQEGVFLRHVALRRGLPEGLALDDERGLLYVADVSTGRVEILDAALLAQSDESARGAFVAEIEIPASRDTPRLRSQHELDGKKRASDSLHSGPYALRLSGDGSTLYVLARFAGAVQLVDVSERETPKLGERHELGGFAVQPSRRVGEITYHTDVGLSRMSCAACHPDGHTGGLLFTKGQPMRIYRSPTMRAVRDSAPYFTPTMLPSLRHMARDVLGRNRFYDPVPNQREIAALAHYAETITSLPNPWMLDAGGLPPTITLEDGREGAPRAGLAIFERLGCESCHPPPQFTTDQDAETRGRLYQGTPLALELRKEMQDMEPNPGWPPVSLVGVWDTFPLLASGAGGMKIDGEAAVPSGRLALREVLEAPLAAGVHAAAASLTPQERDDLIAYLLTL